MGFRFGGIVYQYIYEYKRDRINYTFGPCNIERLKYPWWDNGRLEPGTKTVDGAKFFGPKV